jgi:hypothetical protein
MRSLLFLLCLCSSSPWLFGQTSEVIRSSRPGQSFTPYTVGNSVLQIQSGLNINGFDESVETDGDGLLFVTLGRFGITETIEVRTEFQLAHDELTLQDMKTTSSGLSAWSIGMRFNILDPEDTRKPALGFQFDLNLNVASEDYKADYISPKLLLLHSQSLSSRLGLTTNWGVIWNGNDASPRGLYTFALTYALDDKWSLLLENYGEVEDGDFDSRFDTGIGYLLNNDLQLDLGAGYGKNDGVSDYFLDFGVSARF